MNEERPQKQRIIRLQEVMKVYPRADRPALGPLSLEVNKGEILVVLGPSGCGKTTLLRLIAGLERPNAGNIWIANQLVAASPGQRSWVPPERRSVSMVFQDWALFPHLTVWENVAFGLASYNGTVRQRRVRELLELTDLVGLERRWPHELSGGEQQRVALARALAPNPNVLLLDEPFSNLDAALRPRMRQELVKILKELGTTTVFVTHDQQEALELADRVAVFNQGCLEQLDTPEQIFHQPATRFVADFIGLANFLPGVAKREGILTELGLLPVKVAALTVGSQVEVMIRPQDIALLPLSSEAKEMAVVISRQFRGSENLYTVRLASGLKLFCLQPSRVIYPLGDRVTVRISPQHMVVFHEGKKLMTTSASSHQG